MIANVDTWLALEVAYWFDSAGFVVFADLIMILNLLMSNQQRSMAEDAAPSIAYLTLNEIYDATRFFAPRITDCSIRARLN